MLSACRALLLSVVLVGAEVVEVLVLDSSTNEALTRLVYDGPTECPIEDFSKEGSSISIHYVGTIDKSSKSGVPGSEFDTSHERGKPLQFTLGRRQVPMRHAQHSQPLCSPPGVADAQVIAGWDKGLTGVCQGALLTLVIPPQFGELAHTGNRLLHAPQHGPNSPPLRHASRSLRRRQPE